ncbi:MAG: hypothetical protein M0Z84_06125 [Gammaproteobacteria bacterium]|nr:hypothetical protein [Gammaproteobacteria bacterium]
MAAMQRVLPFRFLDPLTLDRPKQPAGYIERYVGNAAHCCL